ncbi:MAG: hypothetical protein GY938_32675 [Ketobacter sp.]|nr:hypothetical protein [Ketobacter sp.]
MRNELMSRQMDPNSLQNRLLHAQIAREQGGGGNPTAPMQNYGFRDELIADGATDDDLARFDNYVRATPIRKIAQVWHRLPTPGPPVPLSSLQAEIDASGKLATANREADLNARLKLEPQLKNLTILSGNRARLDPLSGDAAVTAADEEAKANVKEKVTQKKNEKAFKVYGVTRGNVMRAMKVATTGYLAGKLPAATASAQIAEHANNILFPAIKKLVRDGESGVFTDQDAMDVRKLMPTRETTPEALPMVMWQLDSWVASKLGQSPPPMPQGFEKYAPSNTDFQWGE